MYLLSGEGKVFSICSGAHFFNTSGTFINSLVTFSKNQSYCGDSS